MSIQHAIRLPVAAPTDPDIDDERRAHWLLSAYTDPVWNITSSGDPDRTATIDFRTTLADGRQLIDADRLCATVKEYAWWVRDARYSRIDDAVTHAIMVRNMMNVAHALSLRKIWTFAHLQPYDLEQLIEECRYGADAILHASERVEAYLQELQAENDLDPKPFGGLPRYSRPGSEAPSNRVESGPIVSACHLPASAGKLPRVAALIARAATANGLKARSGNTTGEVASLSNVTVQALQRSLDPLEQLYAMRRQIKADTIGFRPFSQGAARVAAVKGVGVERTPIPPPKLALHLFEQSARWVFEHEPTAVAAMATGHADRTEVVRMTTACWILIAAFSARRAGEIDDLREGCLRGDEASGWWLHVHIEKTLQRKEWIPVPGLVAHAVEVLSSISAKARQETGTDRLFQWQRSDGKFSRFNVSRHLDTFAATVKVPLHGPRCKPAVEWHWHPHQFRRFFAVLYFYRFEGATIEVLSHHLRHFNLEMTKRYVTQDPEVAALWTDVEWGYAGHVARSIVAGERSVSGAAGERLKKAGRRLVDIFRRRLQVASPERVGASLALVMQRQGMVLTPKPWVTCSCPGTRDAAAKAACRHGSPDRAQAVGPDFARAGPSVCASCPHAITEGARRAVVDVEVAHLEAASASGTRQDTLFGALESARVIELTQVRDTRYQKASPLSVMALDEEKS